MVAVPAELARPAPPGGVGEMVDLVHEVMRSSLHRLHPTLAQEGVTMGQFWALHLVSSLEAASVSSVARGLGVSPPTACANVDQLEAAGLVTRERSARDRRAVVLSLTPRGRKVEARVWGQIGRLMSNAARELPPADIATTVRVFRAIQRRLASDATARAGAA
ncbi:MAG TPA: MarR family transcriptional regulator [Thermoplasmata archaeon]|nr:MarR family transcriptional regulator [Thermoplasmata archaeon]